MTRVEADNAVAGWVRIDLRDVDITQSVALHHVLEGTPGGHYAVHIIPTSLAGFVINVILWFELEADAVVFRMNFPGDWSEQAVTASEAPLP